MLISVLLSFVLSQTPVCQVYETYDPDNKKYEKVCEENEFFNEETLTCEIWNKGEIYNAQLKQCEKKEEEGQEAEPKPETETEPRPEPEPEPGPELRPEP